MNKPMIKLFLALGREKGKATQPFRESENKNHVEVLRR
jgi:hypothetical protein